MSWIKINELQFSSEDISRFDSGNCKTDFEKSTIQFCKAWLGGENEFVIQTSGSTGTPKKIILTRAQMEASARQTINALGLKENYTALVCLDTKYIAGQMMLVRSLTLGMNIVAVEPSSNPFEKINTSEKIDFAAFVPLQLESILEKSVAQLNQLKCAIIGGATVSHLLKAKTKKTSCIIYATYGMTETISHIALQRLNGDNPQDYFEAFTEVQLRLDERGCLCIKTNYLNEEVATNDLVELLNNNKFKWLGRIDNVINSGGIKLIPERIEIVFEKIFESRAIKQRFFITGQPDEKLGQRAVIVIEGNRFENNLPNEIILEASHQLSKYELPKEFIFIDKFKETETGKVKRTL